MNLIHTVTLDYPRSLWQLRQENPNVSFPAEPTDDDLAPFDHANVHPTPPPECDPRTERVDDTQEPQEAADGTWQQTWAVRPATAEEIAAYDAANAPRPDWSAFKATALASESLNGVLAQAYQAAPVAAGSLAPALLRAETNGPDDFAAVWTAICAAVSVPPEVFDGFQQAAVRFHLPPEFVAALNPS